MFPYLIPLLTALLTVSQAKDELEIYNINDIIHKYRNMTEVKRDMTILELKPEYNDNKCMKDALAPILEQCLKTSVNDLNPSLRSRIAAKLSVCEFQIAQIGYPEECRYPEIGDECVTAMEGKAQWWTSYSGYYRSIGEICLEEGSSFEQEKILEVYFKITEYYNSLFDQFQEQFVMSEMFNQQSMEHFSMLKKFMNDLNDSCQENEKMIKLIWLNLMNDLEKMNEVTFSMTDVMIKQTKSMEANLFEVLQSMNDGFSIELTLIKDKFMDQLEENQELAMEYFDNIQSQLYKTNEINKKNFILSEDVNINLHDTLQSSKNLTDSISNITWTMDNLTDTITLSHGQILQIHEIIEKNSLIRFVNHLVNNIKVQLLFSFKFGLMGGSISLLIFTVILVLNSLSSFMKICFQFVGIAVCSLGLGIGLAVIIVSFREALKSTSIV